MSEISASLLSRRWRRIDIKVNVGGELHVLRWRRGWFADAVLFDDRCVASSGGLFNRETLFGLNVKTPAGDETRLLFSIDPEPDWTDWRGTGRPGGVRLETAEHVLVSVGSLGPDRAEPFKTLIDRAIEAVGLS